MKKISCFVVVLSLAAFIPSIGAADSCVPANSKQDKFSAKLAKKGLQREKKAEKILAQVEKDAAKAEQASSADPKSKLDKAKLVDAAIPADLLNKAKCVVVIPGDKKIGLLGYGADYGAGISVCRDSSGKLGAPSFVKIKGGAYGPQIGMKSTDQVLLFMNDNAEQILQKPSLKLGVDAAVAAGPLGRDGAADTNLHMQDEVLSYSHSRGIYAGATLDGAVLEPDTKMTDAVKGEKVKPSFFERMEQDIASAFHRSGILQHSDSCEQNIGAAQAASDVNAAVNAPAEVPAQAAVASSAQAVQAQKQLSEESCPDCGSAIPASNASAVK